MTCSSHHVADIVGQSPDLQRILGKNLQKTYDELTQNLRQQFSSRKSNLLSSWTNYKSFLPEHKQ